MSLVKILVAGSGLLINNQFQNFELWIVSLSTKAILHKQLFLYCRTTSLHNRCFEALTRSADIIKLTGLDWSSTLPTASRSWKVAPLYSYCAPWICTVTTVGDITAAFRHFQQNHSFVLISQLSSTSASHSRVKLLKLSTEKLHGFLAWADRTLNCTYEMDLFLFCRQIHDR